MTTTLAVAIDSRFWPRVDRRGDSECWAWLGGKTTGGYGQFRHEGRWIYTHRLAYEIAKGEIPEGLVIDHLCRNRACANPNHLEAVTRGVNNARGLISYAIRDRCKHGHDIRREENVYVAPNGHRRCRVCMKRDDRARARRRAVTEGAEA